MNSPSIASKSEGILSKRRLGVAGLAAVAACAACCSVPLLVAAGIGGGALTTLAAYLQPGAELVVGLGAAAAVVGIAAVRSRSTRGSCGCRPATRKDGSVYHSPRPSPDEPVVCTADLADEPTVQAQVDGYRAAFALLERTERFPGGFRWVFRNVAGLEARLKELAQNEHQCCRFFAFDVTAGSDRIVWETRADDAASSVLEYFARLPERLDEEPRRGADVAMLKRGSSAAGLGFAADEERP